MPTFGAIALDRLLEPGASKSVDKTVPSSRPVPNSKPPSNSNLSRRNSTSVTDRKVNRPQISPALYTTPEVTPLPDSPSSFPPSPYIINHKRRGPRLSKSFSEDDVSSRRKAIDVEKVNGSTKIAETKVFESTENVPVTFTIPVPIEEEDENRVHDSPLTKEDANGIHDGHTEVEHVNGVNDGELGSRIKELRSKSLSNRLSKEKDAPNLVALNSERDSESEDFFDPQESMSVTSNTDTEDNTGAESSARFATPMGEYFDAWEELSSEGGRQPSLPDFEAELREISLSLLMEIETRKKAEEALVDMRCQWQRIRQQLAEVGLTLPADPTVRAEGDQSDADPAEDLCKQVYLARFVSEAIGRGIAKAEMELEMAAQIESKNFEISRLLDRLNYYEAMNREMSQRNQEAVEMARRDRQRMKRRQRWVWGSIAAVITLGTAALAWSYLPSGKGSFSHSGSGATDVDMQLSDDIE
ncbi:hypothetical protein CFOL_v3_31179 [Cephalotus follicularis]|uniref:Uncharacterized protein n=1 Tax=Cephalotus follicularis TaxID=3775 RepID=A0A1Q3D630_CEPFO|nr:hypothetical protein CFOL_v3_31179 [Cephalotus follicularis]